MKKGMLIGLMLLALCAGGCGDSSDDDAPAAQGQQPEEQEPTKTFMAGFAQAPILTAADNLDGYWLAGFSIVRPALGLHDPLHAVATVLDDGQTRIGIVTLDAFSVRLEDTNFIREALPPSLGIDHLIVHALHNHDVPDNNGMWSFLNIPHGNDLKAQFRERLNTAAVAAVTQAAENLQPARMYLGEDLDHDRLAVSDPTKVSTADVERLANPNPLGLTDLRPPFITDHGVRFAVFRAVADNRVLGSIVNWGNHVETLWRNNQQISADFPGYLRDELSRKLGGTTLFVTGNVGAVTTPENEPEVFYNPDTEAYEIINITTGVTYQGTVYSAADFDKARAQGCAVADVVAGAVAAGRATLSPAPVIRVFRKDFEIGFQNPKFRLVWTLGIMDREGHDTADGGKATYSEINLAVIGDLWLLTLPGELYSEIAVGGVGNPAGADYQIDPVEVPALRTIMHGKVNMMMNLGNDHLGYLIPKSQWDEKAPYAYGYEKAPYGEENSLGPDAAGTIHALAKELITAAGR